MGKLKTDVRPTYREAKKLNICCMCRIIPVQIDRVYCKDCALIESERIKLRRHTRKNNGLCAHCGNDKDTDMSLCNFCLQQARKYTKRRKQICLDAYGNKCACCGIDTFEFLCFDHVNNNGAEHRKTVPAGKIYRWMINNNFPNTMQILCFNCNNAKQFFGECPHTKERRYP